MPSPPLQRLQVEAGEFTDSEIIVMLGENGTGKTTFIRMLAGMLKPGEVHGGGGGEAMHGEGRATGAQGAVPGSPPRPPLPPDPGSRVLSPASFLVPPVLCATSCPRTLTKLPAPPFLQTTNWKLTWTSLPCRTNLRRSRPSSPAR